MKQLVGSFLRSLKLGEKMEYRNLTIFPISTNQAAGHNFLTIDEALETERICIKETSEMGDVPNLMLQNLSDEKVFILDGEELVGAKQNRVTNSVVLVPERDELIIPVSCVERNRWNYKTKRFSSGHTRVYFGLRKKIFQTEMSSRQRQVKSHSQHEVWNDIESKMQAMHIDSTTSAMNDIYKKYIKKLNKFNQKFRCVAGQVGMVVLINNKVVSCEIFSDPEIMEKLHYKILNSYSIDALESYSGKTKKLKTIRRRALKFLSEIKKTEFEKTNSVGLGEDLLFNSDDVCGSALKHEDKLIYMSAYSKVNQ